MPAGVDSLTSITLTGAGAIPAWITASGAKTGANATLVFTGVTGAASTLDLSSNNDIKVLTLPSNGDVTTLTVGSTLDTLTAAAGLATLTATTALTSVTTATQRLLL